ncbi:MAG: histidinol-phosphatase [Bacteroidetes bacterium]|nr:MAG: histidinol-phosphatase [Bacteroidota bacterium]PIE88303.1 MAG: histidinol-phosphatase [Bacteroidota bacterium]
MSATTPLREFAADLHIHTVLSPCGSLDMSPLNIVKEAARKGLDIIGITDHNASAHCEVVSEIAKDFGIFVMCGMEVTTSEEAHCLTFFDNQESLNQFQTVLDSSILKIPNDPDKFGYQVIVNREEEIIDTVDWLLISATSLSINELADKARQYGGIVIPAHIDRSAYSLTSQLGFVPPDLEVNGFEVSKYASPEAMIQQFPYLKAASFIQSSDAHFIPDIGTVRTHFKLKHRSFEEIKYALNHQKGREVFLK